MLQKISKLNHKWWCYKRMCTPCICIIEFDCVPIECHHHHLKSATHTMAAQWFAPHVYARTTHTHTCTAHIAVIVSTVARNATHRYTHTHARTQSILSHTSRNYGEILNAPIRLERVQRKTTNTETVPTEKARREKRLREEFLTQLALVRRGE